MKMLNFAKRNFKEIIRDPLSTIFAVALPLFLLFIFRQFNIPAEAYKLENFTPGIVAFGFSFISMFTATLVAKDRTTSFLIRLGVSPMRAYDYVGGYALAVLPLVLAQNILFFGLALILGLKFTVGIIYSILAAIPLSILFVAIGILLGSVTNEKSSAGISSVVVQLVAFTSGMWFSGDMVGDFFAWVCKVLPFSGVVNIMKALMSASGDNLIIPIITVSVYTLVIGTFAVLIFRRNMLGKA